MGFDIQYGPISTALQLANQAGRGKYYQQNFEDSNQFLNTLNSMQQTNDTRRATDMQNALGYQQANAHNALAQQELAMTQAYHQASLASLNQARSNTNQWHEGTLGVRQGQLSNQTQALGDREANTAAVNAAGGVGGKFAPPMASSSPFQAVKAQLDTLTKQQQMLEAERKNVATEEINPVLKAKTGRVIPRPGQEQAYQQWLAAYQQNQKSLTAAQQQMQQFLQPRVPQQAPAAPAQVNPAMQARTAAAAMGQQQQVGPDGLLPPGVPPVVLSQPGAQQQAAPGTVYRNAQGQRIVFDQQRNAWVPIQ